MRNVDGYIVDVDAYFADRGEQLRAIDQALGFLGETATDEQRERIVDYRQATRRGTSHSMPSLRYSALGAAAWSAFTAKAARTPRRRSRPTEEP